MTDHLQRRRRLRFALLGLTAAVAALIMLGAGVLLTYRMANTSGVVVAQMLQSGLAPRAVQ